MEIQKNIRHTFLARGKDEKAKAFFAEGLANQEQRGGSWCCIEHCVDFSERRRSECRTRKVP